MKYVFQILILFCTFLSGFAQNADPNFGTNGLTTTAFSSTDDMATVSALQPDGKMVVAGFVHGSSQLAVARYLSNGQLDQAFSGDGKITTPVTFAAGAFPQLDIALLSNGKILVMLSNYGDRFYLYRLTSAGALDLTFLNNGFTYFDANGFPGTTIRTIYRMKVQSDGKILVAGKGKMTNNTDGCLVARILSNGYTLDNTFSGDGVTVIDPYQYGSEARDILIQNNGGILVGGSMRPGSGAPYSFGVAQLTSTGQTANLPGSSYSAAAFASGDFRKFVQQTDGKTIIAGEYAAGANIRLTRLLSNFTLDNNFGSLGYAGINWGSSANDLNAVKGISILTNGNILVAGTLYRSSGNLVRITQLNPDGTPLLTFGNQGTLSGVFGTGSVLCNSLQLLPDGSVTLTGSKKNGTQHDMAITRWFLKCIRFRTINKTLCGSEIFYFNNQPYSQAGTFYATVSYGSCDSSYTLNITSSPDVEPAVSITSASSMPVCAGSQVTFQSTVQNGGTNPVYAWKKDFTVTVATTPTYTANANTINGSQISLTITSNHPCASTLFAGSNTIDVTTTPAPVATVTQSNNQVSCPSTAGAQYQWLDCNNGNAPVSGATTRNFSPGQNGSYAVRVTKGNCVTTSACFSFIFTSNSELISENPDGIFPNPASETIRINGGDEIFQVRITDLQGKEMYRDPAFLSFRDIDVRSFSKGVYLVQVVSRSGSSTLKLVVRGKI